MNDRELLELAAKAIGVQLVWGEKLKVGPDVVDCTDMPYVKSNQPDVGDEYWNPLDDDGDALRLMVDLRILLRQRSDMVDAKASPFVAMRELYGTDPYAATRRAIVRAAAAIGKEKNHG